MAWTYNPSTVGIASTIRRLVRIGLLTLGIGVGAVSTLRYVHARMLSLPALTEFQTSRLTLMSNRHLKTMTSEPSHTGGPSFTCWDNDVTNEILRYEYMELVFAVDDEKRPFEFHLQLFDVKDQRLYAAGLQKEGNVWKAYGRDKEDRISASERIIRKRKYVRAVIPIANLYGQDMLHLSLKDLQVCVNDDWPEQTIYAWTRMYEKKTEQ